MSIKVKITVPDDEVLNSGARRYINSAMFALGFLRAEDIPAEGGKDIRFAGECANDPVHLPLTSLSREENENLDNGSISREPNPYWKNNTGETAPKRERGKPAPGRARRTKEEIAEDEAADKADAARAAGAAEAGLQGSAADVKASISTGENRVGPEDDAETQAQDAADEAAERAAKSDGKITHDDLRRAMGDYQKKFGMAAAVRLVGEGGLIGVTADKVPEADLPAVIAKVRAAIDEAAQGATTATRDDIKALMLDYQKKYGNDALLEDGPRIFKSALGDVPAGTKNTTGMEVSQWSLGAIPNDPAAFAKCVQWWKTAINQAPEAFGRKAVS